MDNPKLTAFYLIFNLVNSILVILLNKWVYVNVGFPSMTLTCLHFIVTSVGLHVCRKLNVFTAKSAPLLKILPLACAFCGFVVLTNLSLQTNTLGSYQVAKVMTTPCVVMIQMMWYNKTFSTSIKLTLIPIVFGIGFSFMNDVSLNLIGFIYAVVGFIVTSFYQVLVSEKQHKLNLDSMQLLYYQAPMSAAILLFIVPWFEPLSVSLINELSVLDTVMIISSCLVAFALNLSIYWIIGNTSALTYNMAGHAKFCLTYIGGMFLFQEPLGLNQIIGLLMTMGGVISYVHVKMIEQARETSGEKKDEAAELVSRDK